MKANAPEKIHIQPNAHDRWFEGNIPNGLPNRIFVEYTRTDAFIEKAENFFENYFEEEKCKFGVSEWVEVRSDFESLDSLIRAFLNYIKGE